MNHNTYRILVVEDEPLVLDLIVINLVHAHYQVESACSLEQARQVLKQHQVHLIILDLMLPDGHGTELVQSLRHAGSQCPILLLTAIQDTMSKVRGLEIGSDDYLTKPFDIQELKARIHALLRRTYELQTPQSNVFRLASTYYFDTQHFVQLDTGEAQTNEGPLFLNEKELKMVRLLVLHKNQLLSRADILEEVWGMGSFQTDRSVDNLILRLRKLFEPKPDEPVFFVTLRNRGYLLHTQ